MSIHPTPSLLSGGIHEGAYARRAALLDEIEKIAQQEQKKPSPKWKRIAKSTLGYSAGYAAGHTAGMLADAAASRMFKSKYPHWTPQFKQKVLYPILGLSMVGMMVGRNLSEAQREKILKGNE
jgi:hypothetical protein